MQYTTHYNLNLPEGTDIVNPLVQDNPNYSAIDAAMFANKQAVIGTASEVVSGTVHAITRSNTDSDYFKFTATGNWTAGDSMSVDGTTVSVYLSDGTTPDTGAYIINTEVLALLSGSRVTLLVSSGVSSDIGDLSSLTTTDRSDLVSAINEVNAGLSGNGGSVTVTADGVKTYSQILTELFGLVNFAKISAKSYLVNGTVVGQLQYNAYSSKLVFTGCDNNNFYMYDISSAGSLRTFKCSNQTYTDAGASIAPSGMTFDLYY